MINPQTSGSKEEQARHLAGPQALTLSASHPRGPFAQQSDYVLSVPPVCFTLMNTSSAPRLPATLSVDPLEREQDGASVSARLYLAQGGIPLAEDAGTVAIELGPHEVAQFQLAAVGKLPPGRYVSRLHYSPFGTDKFLVIPVTVRVSAHWLWAVGLMLLGLMFLGLTGLLLGEADVRTKQAEVLALRQDLHEFIERYPLAEADQVTLADTEAKLAVALKTLSASRSLLEIKDWRLFLADPLLAQAREQFQQLRAAAEHRVAGEVEVEDLGKEWENLWKSEQTVIDQLKAREQSLHKGGPWPTFLSAFVRTQREVFLEQLPQVIRETLGPQVERVRLALASGEGHRAQALAFKVRRWLRQAAHLIEERVRLLLGWHVYAEEMLARQAALSEHLRRQELPEEARRELATQLSAAQEALEQSPALRGFQDAYTRLQAAETYTLGAYSQVTIHAAETAMRTAAAETALTEIEEASSRLSPGDPPDIKRAHLLTFVELWRKRVEACRDEALKQALRELLETLSERLNQADLTGMGSGIRELFQRWGAYQDAQIQMARRAVLKPYCAQLAAGLQTQLQVATETVALLEPHSSVAGLAEELDRVRLGLEQVSEEDCLQSLLTPYQRLMETDGQMMAALIMIQNITPEARLAAAEHSEVRAAIDLARRLMAEPWPLHLIVRSHPSERYEQREITFAVQNLNPAWGPGITLVIDFGDNTPLIFKSAEEVRQGAPIAHRYEQSQGVTIRVVAAEAFQPGSRQPVSETLGEGKVELEILPSPISLARELAGQFLNLRFFIALTIGLLVQGWRVGAERPFGAQGKDYIEAFAFGLGIDAGVQGLTELLTKIGLPS